MSTPSKLLYMVGLQASDCCYDVRVNDGPVISTDEESSIATRLPINQWILRGHNTLELMMTRQPNVKGKCQLEVLCLDTAGVQASTYLTGFSVGRRIKESESAPVIERHQAHFEADAPFPEWRWLKSKPEPRLAEKDKTEIVVQLQLFHHALSKKDMDMLRLYYKEKSEEIGISRYQTMAEREKEMESEFAEVWSEGKWSLQPLSLENVQLLHYGNDRLFKAVERESQESPICYRNVQNSATLYIEMIFYRNAREEWKIIR